MIIDSDYIGGKYDGSFVSLGVKVTILTFCTYLAMESIHMELGKIEYASAHESWHIPVNLSSATRICYQVFVEDVD